MQSLAQKIVIITGGSKGIGRVLALKLAKEKACVVITGKNAEQLEKTKIELLNLNKNIIAIRADVSNFDDVRRTVSETINNFGKIDYLINNAGLTTHKTIKEFSIEEWKKVIEVNLIGPFMMSKEVIPYMEKLSGSTGGTIINIASTSGKRGYEGGSAYVASKFGLSGFSECLLKEVRNSNIRVIVIYPSYVDTSIKNELKLHEIGKGVYLRVEDVADAIISTMKLPQRALIKELEIWCTNP